MTGIEDIRGGGKAFEERIISFDNPDNQMEKNSEYVIYTKGINMEAIKNIKMVEAARNEAIKIITKDQNLKLYPILSATLIEKNLKLHFE